MPVWSGRIMGRDRAKEKIQARRQVRLEKKEAKAEERAETERELSKKDPVPAGPIDNKRKNVKDPNNYNWKLAEPPNDADVDAQDGPGTSSSNAQYETIPPPCSSNCSGTEAAMSTSTQCTTDHSANVNQTNNGKVKKMKAFTAGNPNHKDSKPLWRNIHEEAAARKAERKSIKARKALKPVVAFEPRDLRLEDILKPEEIRHLKSILEFNGWDKVCPAVAAVALGRFDLIKKLANDGLFDLHCIEGQRITPMGCAIQTSSWDIINFLIEKDLNHHCKDSFGNTPLIKAALCPSWTDQMMFDFWSCLKEDCRTDFVGSNKAGVTLIHALAFRGWVDVFREVLLVTSLEETEHTVLSLVNAVMGDGCTPLMLAIDKGEELICDLLLSHGAEPLVEDKVGFTPLCRAMGFLVNKIPNFSGCSIPPACKVIMALLTHKKLDGWNLKAYMQKRLHALLYPAADCTNFPELFDRIGRAVFIFVLRCLQGGSEILLQLRTFSKLSAIGHKNMSQSNVLATVLGIIFEILVYSEDFVCLWPRYVKSFLMEGGAELCLQVLQRQSTYDGFVESLGGRAKDQLSSTVSVSDVSSFPDFKEVPESLAFLESNLPVKNNLHLAAILPFVQLIDSKGMDHWISNNFELLSTCYKKLLDGGSAFVLSCKLTPKHSTRTNRKAILFNNLMMQNQWISPFDKTMWNTTIFEFQTVPKDKLCPTVTSIPQTVSDEQSKSPKSSRTREKILSESSKEEDCKSLSPEFVTTIELKDALMVADLPASSTSSTFVCNQMKNQIEILKESVSACTTIITAADQGLCNPAQEIYGIGYSKQISLSKNENINDSTVIDDISGMLCTTTNVPAQEINGVGNIKQISLSEPENTNDSNGIEEISEMLCATNIPAQETNGIRNSKQISVSKPEGTNGSNIIEEISEMFCTTNIDYCFIAMLCSTPFDDIEDTVCEHQGILFESNLNELLPADIFHLKGLSLTFDEFYVWENWKMRMRSQKLEDYPGSSNITGIMLKHHILRCKSSMIQRSDLLTAVETIEFSRNLKFLLSVESKTPQWTWLRGRRGMITSFYGLSLFTNMDVVKKYLYKEFPSNQPLEILTDIDRCYEKYSIVSPAVARRYYINFKFEHKGEKKAFRIRTLDASDVNKCSLDSTSAVTIEEIRLYPELCQFNLVYSSRTKTLGTRCRNRKISKIFVGVDCDIQTFRSSKAITKTRSKMKKASVYSTALASRHCFTPRRTSHGTAFDCSKISYPPTKSKDAPGRKKKKPEPSVTITNASKPEEKESTTDPEGSKSRTHSFGIIPTLNKNGGLVGYVPLYDKFIYENDSITAMRVHELETGISNIIAKSEKDAKQDQDKKNALLVEYECCKKPVIETKSFITEEPLEKIQVDADVGTEAIVRFPSNPHLEDKPVEAECDSDISLLPWRTANNKVRSVRTQTKIINNVDHHYLAKVCKIVARRRSIPRC